TNDSLLHGTQTVSQILRQDRGNRGDAESHRGTKDLVRSISPGSEADSGPSRRRLAGRLFLGFSDQGFFRDVAARIRRLSFRGSEIRRRGVSAAFDDVRRAAQGD